MFDTKRSVRSARSLRSRFGDWLEFYAVVIGERRRWQPERLVAGQDGGVLGTARWQCGSLRHDERRRGDDLVSREDEERPQGFARDLLSVRQTIKMGETKAAVCLDQDAESAAPTTPRARATQMLQRPIAMCRLNNI